jgi:hypothetical protein
MNEWAEAVAEDSALGPTEKETSINFVKGDERASVYTEEAGLMRRLLLHPHFEATDLRVTRDGTGSNVAPSDFEEGSITGVKGNIPIATLVLQTSPRTTSEHSLVVPEGVLRVGGDA